MTNRQKKQADLMTGRLSRRDAQEETDREREKGGGRGRERG